MNSTDCDQMLKLMSQGVWQVDAAGKTIFANSRMLAMVGYSQEEFLPLPSLSLVGAQDRGWIAARMASRRHGVRDDYECQIERKDGSWVSVMVEAVPLRRDDGQFDGTIALVTDIGDRRRTEDALRFSMLTRDLQVGVLVQGPGTEVLLSNLKALELLGLTEDQLLGKSSRDPTWQVIHEDGRPFSGPQRPAFQAIATRQAVRGVVMGVFRPSTEDHVWLLVDAIPELGPDGSVRQVVCTFTDITARRQAEEALRKSATLLTGLTNAVPDPLFMTDRERRCLFANPAALSLLGGSRQHVLGKTTREFLDDSRVANVLTENDRRVIESGVAQVSEEIFPTSDGDRVLQTARAPLCDEAGRVIGIVGCGRDVTERKKVEEALRVTARALQRSESQTQMALELGHAGSWHYDIQTGQIWGSAEGLRIFGYPAVARYWAIEDIEACIPERERVHHALLALLSDGCPYDLEYVIHPADGSPPRELHSVATVTRDGDGNPIEVVGFVQDITERKRAEDNLRRLAAELTEANRLKDIFTDVLRHDIINPAGAIQNATDVLLTSESDAMKREALHGIRQAAANLIEMTVLASRLAATASGDDLAFSAADPVAALQSVVEDFTHELKEKNITLTDQSEGEFTANFHPIVKQVFANLISNAIKYSPSGTRIDVCAQDRGEFWVCSVKDQGVGVPDEHKRAIFHRFERLGRGGVRGTGLGLAIAEQVVRLHRGHAWVEDNPAGGSVFFVKLPKKP